MNARDNNGAAEKTEFAEARGRKDGEKRDNRCTAFTVNEAMLTN